MMRLQRYLYTGVAVVHLNFRARSTFPVPVPSSLDRTSRCNKVDTDRLYASYRLNLLLLKGQRCLCTELTLCLFPYISGEESSKPCKGLFKFIMLVNLS